MKPLGTVAIVGVGLIGGSIGLALRQRRLAREVVGIGRRSASLRKAQQRKAVDWTTTDLERGVSAAELVVVCTPVASIAEHVRRAATACPPEALITDVGSTKAAIVHSLDRQLGARRPSVQTRVGFVGSHPLAGDHRTGPEHAREDLFDGRIVVVTPTPRSREEDVSRVRRFWSSLGGEVVIMTPRSHDQALAATSHLPHLIAAALVAATPDAHGRLVASGWFDTTRIAAGDPELWCDILLGNRQNVLRSLKRLERAIARLSTALERGRADPLQSLLEKAKRKRDALGG